MDACVRDSCSVMSLEICNCSLDKVLSLMLIASFLALAAGDYGWLDDALAFRSRAREGPQCLFEDVFKDAARSESKLACTGLRGKVWDGSLTEVEIGLWCSSLGFVADLSSE